MAAKKSKLPITIFELVVYILAGLLSLWGLVYIALGISCLFLRFDNALVLADLNIKAGTNNMGFLEQGIMILFIGVAVVVTVLLVNAKSADREYEKEQRRKAARFNRNKKNLDEQQETIVEVESEPVEQ